MKLLKKFFGLFKKKERALIKTPHQIHLEYIKSGFVDINDINVSSRGPVIDIKINSGHRGLIWICRESAGGGIIFSEGLGMYSTKEEHDELITALYEALEGSPLQARVFSQIMAQKLNLPLDDDGE